MSGIATPPTAFAAPAGARDRSWRGYSSWRFS
jgi:hypothetical protein